MGIVLGIGQTRPQTPYDYFYGIEWDVTVSNPKPTRIGKMELHASLPVQSLMRRCVLRDNGTIAYYLHANDSTKRDNSAEAKLDGTDGQVMVEIPTCYVKFEADGNKRRFLMSTHELPGFQRWERCFVSAYEATIQRSTSKLSSVVNATADYRGGNNDASKDDKFTSQLGRPATNFNTTNARTYARNRGSANWNCNTYNVQKALFWFFAVEYCNFNSQDTFNASLDDNGYRQGGLGKGITDLGNWDKFGYYPPVPCGITNSLGNKSGYVEYVCAKSDDGSLAPQTLQAISYRGVENPFGHCWAITDGAKCLIQSDADGGRSEFYVCNDKEKWNSNGVADYEFRGVLPRKEGYVKELVLGEFGEIMPLNIGAGSTTYFCDYFYTNIPGSGVSERVLLFGGNAYHGAAAGFVYAYANWAASAAFASVGSRLCFIP
ncbi:hypothetical protein HMPREF1981_01993 [Bacteroides pyogenes F0041]|uniref:Uncharacterized protein n=1 Tax=Bacteroides pyogenes F0041 TaxID=1321819 RepID=U2DYX2_9BACE|nr:hypothetical protein [Bacteroides pyogenes]ERI85106.1 hypothetical protein HMPREF1981_01993 [Bacteroides pyogenes F0041]